MSLLNDDNRPLPAKALRGFSDINRYWDRQNLIYAAKILPGQYYVTVEKELIVTVLGSCVSACIRDPLMGIGGMNHFMLPTGEHSGKLMERNSDATRYGNFAMEKLINDILKHGGRRENLEVKVFGGGKVIEHMTEADIGGRNIKFVREFLATEGLKIVSEDLGDVYPRKVIYEPQTGKVRIKKLRSMHNETIAKREESYKKELDNKPVSGDIELFD